MALTGNEKALLEAAREMGFREGEVFTPSEGNLLAIPEHVIALILACQAAVIAGMLPDIVDVTKRNMYKARLEQIEARSMELANC